MKIKWIPRMKFNKAFNITIIVMYTVKPVLRGHLWDREKVVF